MVNFINDQLKSTPTFQKMLSCPSCPGLLEVSKSSSEAPVAKLTVSHICDLQAVHSSYGLTSTDISPNQNNTPEVATNQPDLANISVSTSNESAMPLEANTAYDAIDALGDSCPEGKIDADEITSHHRHSSTPAELTDSTETIVQPIDRMNKLSAIHHRVQSVIIILPHKSCMDGIALTKYINYIDSRNEMWTQGEGDQKMILSTYPIDVNLRATHSFLEWYVSTVLFINPTMNSIALSVLKERVFNGGITKNEDGPRINHMHIKTEKLSAIIPYQPVIIHYCASFEDGDIQEHLLNANEMVILPPLSTILIVPCKLSNNISWSYVLHLSFAERNMVEVSSFPSVSFPHLYLYMIGNDFLCCIFQLQDKPLMLHQDKDPFTNNETSICQSDAGITLSCTNMSSSPLETKEPSVKFKEDDNGDIINDVIATDFDRRSQHSNSITSPLEQTKPPPSDKIEKRELMSSIVQQEPTKPKNPASHNFESSVSQRLHVND